MALAMLALSALALLFAPTLMADSYSWITHTASESAAQATDGAWLARLGFLLFGLAVIWIAALLSPIWARGAVWMHLTFGVCMLGTAVFSHHPWLEGVPFDPLEDALHSLTATVMGFAFSFGVLARLLQRDGRDRAGKLLDGAAIGAAVFIPLLMLYQPDIEGLVQRLMFLIAYIWYAKETAVLASWRSNALARP
jgi:hypothetical protein